MLQRLRKLLLDTDRKDQQHLNALQENKESSIAENFSAIKLSLFSGRALKNTNRNISEKTDDKVKVRFKTEDVNNGLDTYKQNNNDDKLSDNIDIVISKEIKENAYNHNSSSIGTESSATDVTQPIRDRKGNRRKKQPGITHDGLIVRESSITSHERNMTIVAI